MEGSRWRDETWRDQAVAWVDDRLSDLGRPRTGSIEQPHIAPWSTVLKVPTDDGPVWFKANTESLRHEAGIVALLTERCPGAVSPLLAADPASGWMLMDDAGEMLRTVVARERSLECWCDVLEGYAQVQLACEAAVEDLLALGVPDLRLSVLPEKYDALMVALDADDRFRDASATVRDLAADLARYGIHETLQHDDLHDAQVFVRDGTHLLMDWGDACVSHPFFTLAVTLEGVIAWGLDDEPDSEDLGPYLAAYLAPYRRHYPHLSEAELQAAARIGTRLGWACRAVNGHVPGDDKQTDTRLRMFLDGHP